MTSIDESAAAVTRRRQSSQRRSRALLRIGIDDGSIHTTDYRRRADRIHEDHSC